MGSHFVEGNERPKIRIRFVWFFDNNGIQTTFFRGYFESLGYTVEIVKNSTDFCDIEFVGVFRPRKDLLRSKLNRITSKNVLIETDAGMNYPYVYETNTRNYSYRVWLTTENVRPPVQEDFDLILSFDQTSFGENHAYFPQWLMQIGLFGPANLNHLGIEASTEDLSKPRKISRNQMKKRFCCSIFANPHNVRLHAIKVLDPVIDVFGPYVSKPVKSKFEIASKYKFMLCFENDLYPGYVTEKLIEAYLSETVPLYWGDLGNDDMINRASFVNLKDFSSMSEFIDYVVTMDESTYKKIYEEPFLNSKENVEEFFDKLSQEKLNPLLNRIKYP